MRNFSWNQLYSTVWTLATFSSTIFCKTSVKLTFSLKSYTVNQFDENIFHWGKISEITALYSMLQNGNFFREIKARFVKWSDLVLNYAVYCFHESFSKESKVPVFSHTVLSQLLSKTSVMWDPIKFFVNFT